MWLFGYGSLIWKVDFPIEKRVVGCIKGFTRRFYQASPEHRGNPEKPGRVVTLLPGSKEDVVWGVAYEVSKENVATVLDHLDYREKSGYEKRKVMFYPRDKSWTSTTPFELTVYIAEPQNQWFVIEPDVNVIASHIAQCKGKSGTNVEYLFKLADAVRSIAPDACDSHLNQLETLVRNLISKNGES